MTAIKNFLRNFNKKIPSDYLTALLFFAFCTASGINLLCLDDYDALTLSAVNTINIAVFWTVFAICGAVMLFVAYYFNKKYFISRGLLVSVAFFGFVTSLYNSRNIYLIIGFAVIVFLSVYWCVQKNRININNPEISTKAMYISILCIALLVGTVLFVTAYCRYKSYNAPNFDFGIFASAFENMRKTGLPVTTCERNVVMSHFGVHFSPVFYLLLPVYMLCPCPETLIFLQVLFIIAGVIPTVLICRHFKIENILTFTIAIVYLIFPGFICGGINDFHENAFLTFIILFLMYFILENKNVMFWIFLGLLFSVKEDAAIYAFAIGLFMMFYRKSYLKSAVVIVLSVAYFIFASLIVEACNTLDTGIMTDRLINYMPKGQNSLLSVVYTCFYDFPYLIAQVFNSEKLGFLMWVLIPLGFAPFMSKKKSLLLLLLPLLVINLMSNWQYQYDIEYHYTFGTGALLIFCFITVIEEKSNKKKAFLCIFSLIMSFIMCAGASFDKLVYIPYYTSKSETFSKWDEFISKLSKDKEYTATSELIAHMYDFSQVYAYPDYYGENRQTPYLLITENDFELNPNLENYIEDNNYKISNEYYGIILYEK